MRGRSEGALDDLFERALLMHQSNRLADAQQLYLRVLQLQPNHAECWRLLGIMALQVDRPQQAVEHLARALVADPSNAAACNDHGTALCRLGQHEAALQSFRRAIQLKPDFTYAHYNLGTALLDLRRHEAAIESFEHALRFQKDQPDAHYNRGIALYHLGRFEDAVASYDRALALSRAHADAWYNRGNALQGLGRHEAAVQSFDAALALQPRRAEACYNRGNALFDLRRYDAALDSYDRALALRPQDAECHVNRGVALGAVQRHREALAAFEAALLLAPKHAVAHNNRGNALRELQRPAAALACYEAALAQRPTYADAHYNRGRVLLDLRRYQEALASFDAALAIDPEHADAHGGRATVYHQLADYPAAVAAYDRAIALQTRALGFFGLRLQSKMQMCDWRSLESEIADLFARIERSETAATPLSILALPSSAAQQLKAAKIWAQAITPVAVSAPTALRATHGRCRVGYFSADFRQHAVSTLMAQVFELHDRERFEVLAFSLGPDTKDAMRERLEHGFDRFLDVREQSDEQIAALARELDLDIAVDLGGYTFGARPGIFARRAAPVQLSYLGYLGTMGAPYMDYLIADPVIVPPEAQRHYAEKIVYLPSYQANDSQRRIAERQFSRAELGLPSEGFVFCCFNGSYKVTPESFSGWMRILGQVPGSVLFLYAGAAAVEDNLRLEAQRRGIDAQRLVFGGNLPMPEYLARYRAADLFLDTTPYNAGTTASDALWAGLPVLTRLGETFAGRVAGSLLTAVGLPELITASQEEYERLAVELGRDPQRTAALRHQLAERRPRAALFDTPQFVKHLEEGYRQVHERRLAGLPCDHLWVNAA